MLSRGKDGASGVQLGLGTGAHRGISCLLLGNGGGKIPSEHLLCELENQVPLSADTLPALASTRDQV